MELQIISDMHIEFEYSEPNFDLLKFLKKWLQLPKVTHKVHAVALLGDICNLASPVGFAYWKNTLTILNNYFDLVFVIAGNHEYYHDSEQLSISFSVVNKNMRTFCDTLPHVYLLNQDSVCITLSNQKRYRVFGATLWTSIPALWDEITRCLNDYEYILYLTRKFTPQNANKIHNEHRHALESAIEQSKRDNIPLIVLTHHKPYVNYDSDLNRYTEIRNVGYETDLSELIKPPIIMWAYGHTHKHDETIINGVQIISNPKGYRMEQNVKHSKQLLFSV